MRRIARGISMVALAVGVGAVCAEPQVLVNPAPPDLPNAPPVTPPEGPPSPPAAPPALVLGTNVPRAVIGGTATKPVFGASIDRDALARIIQAGVNYVEGLGVLEAVTKDSGRQALRREFVAAAKAHGVAYGHTIPLEGERVEDERFLGGGGWLDEPFLYFPDRAAPEGAYDDIVARRDVAGAAERYGTYIRGLLDAERANGRPDAKMPSIVNIVESAWYDLKAGCRGFWCEAPPTHYLQQIHYFNAAFNLAIPETVDSYVRLSAAFNRGASRNFGGLPGRIGTDTALPEALHLEIVLRLFERGATYFFFWAFHEVDSLSERELVALVSALRERARTEAPSRARATKAILLPAGYHIPTGPYYSPALCAVADCKGRDGQASDNGLWNLIPIVGIGANDPHVQTLRWFGAAVKDALASPDEFDILVDDDALRPDVLASYATIARRP
jgi:hypothetical protein